MTLEGLIELLGRKEAEKFINMNLLPKALDLAIDFAVECGLGYDNMPEVYVLYKDKIEEMSYTNGFKYIFLQEALNEWEEGK